MLKLTEWTDARSSRSCKGTSPDKVQATAVRASPEAEAESSEPPKLALARLAPAKSTEANHDFLPLMSLYDPSLGVVMSSIGNHCGGTAFGFDDVGLMVLMVSTRVRPCSIERAGVRRGHTYNAAWREGMSDVCAARCRQDGTAQPCGTHGGTVIDRQVLLVCVCGSAECRRERPRLVDERPE